MWLNSKLAIDSVIETYRTSLLSSSPKYIVIDGLFDPAKLDDVLSVLQQSRYWQSQQHTYAALYVDNAEWQKTSSDQRFVQRDVWRYAPADSNINRANNAHAFLTYLRGGEFTALLSAIFAVALTDVNVGEPEINTNYFRLGAADFIAQHADDSPGREVCMLLYFNKDWNHTAGGELTFLGTDDTPIRIAPLFNRCVLFDPSSIGSEHWVEPLNIVQTTEYRYNVTSWYWSE
jgi:SM-20-related protein